MGKRMEGMEKRGKEGNKEEGGKGGRTKEETT